MIAGFSVDRDRSGHPDLSRRMTWSVLVPTVVHLEIPMDAKLAALAKAARAAVATATAGASSLDDLVADARAGVKAGAERMRAELGHGSRNVTDFLADVARLSCMDCTRGQRIQAGGNAQICRHDPLDDPLVVEHQANEPVCLHFATEMFEKLVYRAGRFYAALDRVPSVKASSHAAPPLASGSFNTLSLRLSTTPKFNGSVDGSTRFPPGDASGDRQAEVILQLPAELDAAALSELCYVIFHEIFVHGPESWERAGQRIATRSTCPMREGFVDAAAAFVLVEELIRKGLAFISFPNLSEWLASGVRASQRMRSTPASAAAAGRDVNLAAIRLIGSMVFDRYVDRNLGKTGASLAAAINLLDTTEQERGAYLGILGEAALLMTPEPAYLHTREYRLASRLRQVADRRPVDFTALRRLLDEWKDLARCDF